MMETLKACLMAVVVVVEVAEVLIEGVVLKEEEAVVGTEASGVAAVATGAAVVDG